MKKLERYFRIRNYIEKLRWTRLFSNITDSSIGDDLKIHCSSMVIESKIKNSVWISKNVSIINSKIGDECRIMSNTYLYKATFGDYSYVNMHSFILRAKIGRFCSIGSHVYIGPGTHPTNFVSTHPFTFLKDYGNFISEDDDEIIQKREKISVEIGNDVWIGQGVIVMDNVKIGDGAIVGAHSVVTKDVEPYSIVVGNPAKRLKYRFDEESIKKLLDIKWWNWDKDRIRKNAMEFKNKDKFIQNQYN